MDCSFDLANIRAGIRPMRLIWYPRLRSTNSQAARLRKAGELFAPAVVLTGRQVAGRGRGDNSWWAGPGCLTATFVFPIEEYFLPHQLPLIAGLAVRRVAVELADTADVQLKWPNDVMYRGRKLAGLLCERIGRADLIGVGLNVNTDLHTAPADLRGRIASLNRVAGRSLDMSDVLILLARRLHETLRGHREREFRQFVCEYDQHHALRGKKVTVRCGDQRMVRGRCDGIDSMGRLVLRERGRVHRVIAGVVLAS